MNQHSLPNRYPLPRLEAKSESKSEIYPSPDKKLKTEFYSIATKPHHPPRHDENAKKPLKHSLDESAILDMLGNQCECSTPCFTNFSVQDVILIRKKFDYHDQEELNESELNVGLVNYLGLQSLKQKERESHKIGEHYYHLIFPTVRPGIHLCSKAFCNILGIGEKKIRNAASHYDSYGTSIPDSLPVDNYKFAPKQDAVISFMAFIQEHFTHEVECERSNGTIFKYSSLIGFYEPHDLYLFYQSFDEIGFNVSYDWFRHVWIDKFPNLHTSTDRPCPICAEFVDNIKTYEIKGEGVSAETERKRMNLHISMIPSLLVLLFF